MIEAIVYTTNAGHTKEYAELLGRELSLPVYDLRDAHGKLPKGSEVIYLGWLMAGKVKGYRKASGRFAVRCLCGVGMAENGTQLNDVRKTNKVPEELPVFTLQGGFELEKLHGVYRLMMRTMEKTVGKGLSDKAERTAEEDEMLDLLMKGGNRVNRDNLEEVILWYRTRNEIG